MRTIHSALLRHCIYPIGGRIIGSDLMNHIRLMERSQWWTPEELKKHQESALKSLVEHAYENVPYYRDLFRERGLTDRDVSSVEDLQKLPTLTKAIIRRNPSRMTATNLRKWRPSRSLTSGSTGEPFSFFVSMNAISLNWAGLFRGWGWAGYDLGDKMILLGGTSLVPSHINMVTRLRYLAERKIPLTSYGQTKRQLDECISQIMNVKPKYIYGFASRISHIARRLMETENRDIRLEAIFTTAESLLPGQRKLIEGAFGCEVFDQYGCYDGGVQALECRAHEGYHISEEKAITEILDDDERGVPLGRSGEIVSTDLFNYAMPFIRYKTGDIGAMSQHSCSCGRGLPMIKSIRGRVADQITLRDGSKVPGLEYGYPFEDIEMEEPGTFVCYQVIQRSVDAFRVKVVPGPNYSEDVGIRVVHALRMQHGEDVVVEIELVDEIPTTKAGKLRFIISEIDGPRTS